MTWLDENARAGSVMTACMEDHFAADIVEFEWTHQMCFFFVKNISLLDSLPILLLFIRSSFFDRVTLQLMTFLSVFFCVAST
jgi:hypothetical protein